MKLFRFTNLIAETAEYYLLEKHGLDPVGGDLFCSSTQNSWKLSGLKSRCNSLHAKKNLKIYELKRSNSK